MSIIEYIRSIAGRGEMSTSLLPWFSIPWTVFNTSTPITSVLNSGPSEWRQELKDWSLRRGDSPRDDTTSRTTHCRTILHFPCNLWRPSTPNWHVYQQRVRDQVPPFVTHSSSRVEVGHARRQTVEGGSPGLVSGRPSTPGRTQETEEDSRESLSSLCSLGPLRSIDQT